MDVLEAELARRVPGGTPAEQEVHRFHTLWDAAAEDLPDAREELDAQHDATHKLGEAGDPAGAAADLLELVKDQTRVLGADHRDTLNSRYQAARFRRRAENRR